MLGKERVDIWTREEAINLLRQLQLSNTPHARMLECQNLRIQAKTVLTFGRARELSTFSVSCSSSSYQKQHVPTRPACTRTVWHHSSCKTTTLNTKTTKTKTLETNENELNDNKDNDKEDIKNSTWQPVQIAHWRRDIIAAANLQWKLPKMLTKKVMIA